MTGPTADLERAAERAALQERLDHCLTCGSHTASVRFHLHRPEDEALHRLATARAKQREAEQSIAYWANVADQIERDPAQMEQVAASLANLTPFGKRVAARHFPDSSGGVQ